jgi:hypothetical protein
VLQDPTPGSIRPKNTSLRPRFGHSPANHNSGTPDRALSLDMEGTATRLWPDPGWAANVPAERIPEALAAIIEAQALLVRRLANAPERTRPDAAAWTLTVDDLIRKTGKSRRWLFRHRDLPFIRSITRKSIVGDASLLRDWISQQP